MLKITKKRVTSKLLIAKPFEEAIGLLFCLIVAVGVNRLCQKEVVCYVGVTGYWGLTSF